MRKILKSQVNRTAVNVLVQAMQMSRPDVAITTEAMILDSILSEMSETIRAKAGFSAHKNRDGDIVMHIKPGAALSLFNLLSKVGFSLNVPIIEGAGEATMNLTRSLTSSGTSFDGSEIMIASLITNDLTELLSDQLDGDDE